MNKCKQSKQHGWAVWKGNRKTGWGRTAVQVENDHKQQKRMTCKGKFGKENNTGKTETNLKIKKMQEQRWKKLRAGRI